MARFEDTVLVEALPLLEHNLKSEKLYGVLTFIELIWILSDLRGKSRLRYTTMIRFKEHIGIQKRRSAQTYWLVPPAVED